MSKKTRSCYIFPVNCYIEIINCYKDAADKRHINMVYYGVQRGIVLRNFFKRGELCQR